ncbi:DUF4124 domain-containing protein [Aestuariirhabdus litorea]|uniref:DUF4124 domain-containing protein n=1 Tax=Aestuariirhabdus litorea TaxID=2528527 RepID=A0A3P3VRX7_9GAMM|nr:DUF4124 domain-containing protein [Aestuariirhabdus litorea]RRJ85380.1 DUF4124 domain-containing protein [Aestuariirhabdus litorea]RWW98604.1 DUF4124 domain-containing protein [Endozoicomonadaceae bacterium GTF-13]
MAGTVAWDLGRLPRLLVLLALVVQGAEAEVYRCVDEDGVRYADQPCGPNAEAVILPEIQQSDPVSPPPYTTGVAPLREPPERVNRPAREPQRPDYCPDVHEITTAVRLGRIKLCMTKEQVLAANRRSEPSRRSFWNDQGDLFEYWHYGVRSEGWPREVRFKNGIVRGFGDP